MQALTDGLILYHGSYCEVRRPVLEKCAPYKDFGKGFYLTSSREQAVSFLKSALQKAILNGTADSHQNYGVLSAYRFYSDKDLSVYTFETADSDWLHCVTGHRRQGTFPNVVKAMKTHDIIIGKIADDRTNSTLIAYMAGAYGEVGSLAADSFCISRLLPERLKDQFCFRTVSAIQCLSFIGSEQIWIKTK